MDDEGWSCDVWQMFGVVVVGGDGDELVGYCLWVEGVFYVVGDLFVQYVWFCWIVGVVDDVVEVVVVVEDVFEFLCWCGFWLWV